MLEYVIPVVCNDSNPPKTSNCGINDTLPGSYDYAVLRLRDKGNVISNNFSKLNSNQTQLTDNIGNYYAGNILLSDVNKYPDYAGSYNYADPTNSIPKTTNDGMSEDLDVMLLRQNNFYIFGTITMGTILIIAITIGSI